MKRVSIAAGGVLATLVGVMLVLVLRPESETTPAVAESAAPLAAESMSVDEPPRIDNTAWHVLDPDTVDELPVYKEVVPGRVLVRISDSLANWNESDEVVLEIPQLGGSFDGLVERVEVDPWGNRSYTGLLEDADGRDYRFTITVGPENVFAQLGTSQGTFELVASNEIGWLMASRYMDQHVDYSQPDYYIIEEPTPDAD